MTRAARCTPGRSRHSMMIGTIRLALAVGISACGVDAPTGTSTQPTVLAAKSGGGSTISVTSAAPSYARQGDVRLVVRVYGSGFAAGAQARWLVGADSLQVITISTTVLSSTEIEAVVTVSATATLSLYDIAVTNPGGKKGVGVELFTVTTAELLGSGNLGGDAVVLAANNDVKVVGYEGGGPPFVFDGTSVIALGATGQAWGIDPSGDVITGRDDLTSKQSAAAVWTRAGAGSYVRTWLPLPSGGTGGIARRIAQAASGDLLAGGTYRLQVSRNTGSSQPVLWRRSGGTWQAPVSYVNPGVDAHPFDVTPSGTMAGWYTLSSGGTKGIVWESPTTYATLDANRVNAINDAGTIVAGLAPEAAIWFRDPATGAWNSTPVRLPVGNSSCASSATDVNDAYIVVGYACAPGSSKQQGAIWWIDPVGRNRVVRGPEYLQGLDVSSAGGVISKAAAITNRAPYVVVGEARAAPTRVAVRWPLP